MYALEVLGLMTLLPHTRRAVLGARMRRNRLGVSILLGAAAGTAFMGNSEVRPRFLALFSCNSTHTPSWLLAVDGFRMNKTCSLLMAMEVRKEAKNMAGTSYPRRWFHITPRHSHRFLG